MRIVSDTKALAPGKHREARQGPDCDILFEEQATGCRKAAFGFTRSMS